MPTITTRWEKRTYDVWGNAEDGFEVNDSYSHGEIEIEIEPTVNNEGTPHEFTSAHPTDDQLREIFDILEGVEIDVTGDDLNIYVNIAEDGYPAGELFCVSHESLSPIKDVSR